jgi:hypothetical protein
MLPPSDAHTFRRISQVKGGVVGVGAIENAHHGSKGSGIGGVLGELPMRV